MDIQANDLVLFARVIEAGSFSRAAERAGLPKSTVSRRISELESRLGERLLTRTTRKLSLTEFGQGLLDHAREVAEQVEAAALLAQHRQARPSGRLRISATADFADIALGAMLVAFVARYPDVLIELDLTARRVDLVAERFDLAIRMGELSDDATLAARHILRSAVGLYASPAYVAGRGQPVDPIELAHHDGLFLPNRSGGPAPWLLTREAVVHETTPPGRAIVNSPELLILFARAGCGIAALTDLYVAPHLASGELVRVLPQWQLPAVDAWAVLPGRRLMPAKTRVFLDMLGEWFDPSQAQAAAVASQGHRRPGRPAR